MKKVLLVNNVHIIPRIDGGYPIQMRYLCKMFTEYGYKIFNFTSCAEGEPNQPFTKLYSYSELIRIYTHNNVPIYEEDFFTEITFLFHQRNIREIEVDDINTILKQNNIDLLIFLGDVFVFYKNSPQNRFIVPNYVWYPCHFYPFSNFDLKGLRVFDNIICLSPSIKLILEKEFPDKNVSYLPILYVFIKLIFETRL